MEQFTPFATFNTIAESVESIRHGLLIIEHTLESLQCSLRTLRTQSSMIEAEIRARYVDPGDAQ